ncbi:hypothetical protein ACFWOL_33590 [Streptomyces sp. NPDC058442]|uniref:hypothetical protein n=1 Tax=Streptomyces sp. NPDC058442 TaxID=3346503 RepID=UPI00364823DB
MTVEWLKKFRRERRVPARVRRAAWRLEQAERERDWALAAARHEKVSVRKVAEAAGLSPTRVHQLTPDADLDVLDAVLGQLRAAGWPAPEDPDGSDDEELSDRTGITERLQDEAAWVRQCAEWLDHLDGRPYPPAAHLRPEGNFPDTCAVPIRLPRVAAILRRIAFDVEELARARCVEELQAAKVVDDPRAERRRRLAEPDLSYTEYCDRTTTPWHSTRQGDLAWTAYQAERRRRGETEEDPDTAYHPFRQGRH